MGRLGVSRKRTRHPNDTRVSHPKLQPNGIYPAHVDAKGRVFNGKSNRPLRANPQDKTLNLTGPPSDKTLAIIQSGVILRPSQIHNVRQRIIGVVVAHDFERQPELPAHHRAEPEQFLAILGLAPGHAAGGKCRQQCIAHGFISMIELTSSLMRPSATSSRCVVAR